MVKNLKGGNKLPDISISAGFQRRAHFEGQSFILLLIIGISLSKCFVSVTEKFLIDSFIEKVILSAGKSRCSFYVHNWLSLKINGTTNDPPNE